MKKAVWNHLEKRLWSLKGKMGFSKTRNFFFFRQGPIAFEDVAVDFSLEEWVLLNPDQKALHKQIMEEMNGIVDSLGKAPSLMGISVSKGSISLNRHSH
uniref:KRAB domain-containing protein n=1 Tax=Anolis carolinensis TaxID=28377 RepID=A0A803SYW5_ANOCA